MSHLVQDDGVESPTAPAPAPPEPENPSCGLSGDMWRWNGNPPKSWLEMPYDANSGGFFPESFFPQKSPKILDLFDNRLLLSSRVPSDG